MDIKYDKNGNILSYSESAMTGKAGLTWIKSATQEEQDEFIPRFSKVDPDTGDIIRTHTDQEIIDKITGGMYGDSFGTAKTLMEMDTSLDEFQAMDLVQAAPDNLQAIIDCTKSLIDASVEHLDAVDYQTDIEADRDANTIQKISLVSMDDYKKRYECQLWRHRLEAPDPDVVPE